MQVSEAPPEKPEIPNKPVSRIQLEVVISPRRQDQCKTMENNRQPTANYAQTLIVVILTVVNFFGFPVITRDPAKRF